jgi:hypothetical protein
MEEMRHSYKVFVGKSERKRPLEKQRRGWEDNIRMNLREIWWECVDRINLAVDRDQWRALVNTIS